MWREAESLAPMRLTLPRIARQIDLCDDAWIDRVPGERKAAAIQIGGDRRERSAPVDGVPPATVICEIDHILRRRWRVRVAPGRDGMRPDSPCGETLQHTRTVPLDADPRDQLA